jgi:hypothetical protein
MSNTPFTLTFDRNDGERIPLAKFALLFVGTQWTWALNSRCKHLVIFMDTRTREVRVYDRDNKAVTWDELAFQIDVPRPAGEEHWHDREISAAEYAQALTLALKSIEEYHMQAAAVMTATIQNTPTTIKDRIGRENPYWTQAYADVCAAVDREMRERARAEKAEAEIERLKKCMETNAGMLAKYGPECFPEINAEGQKHFVRVMMESAAEDMRETISGAPANQNPAPESSGHSFTEGMGT